MPDRRHILLVLENGIAEMPKVRYTGDSSQHAFNHAVAMHQHEGFSGHHDIRYGDKASEFIKYIAVAPSLAAIIWGSDEDIVTSRRRKKSDWFEKVRPHIHTPIVNPKTRAKGALTQSRPMHKSPK